MVLVPCTGPCTGGTRITITRGGKEIDESVRWLSIGGLAAAKCGPASFFTPYQPEGKPGESEVKCSIEGDFVFTFRELCTIAVGPLVAGRPASLELGGFRNLSAVEVDGEEAE